MRGLREMVIGIGSSLALAVAAEAQPNYGIGVFTLSNGSAAVQGSVSGEDALIQLDGDPVTPGLQPIDGYWQIIIRDSLASTTVAPQASVGKVVIEGSAAESALVAILVRGELSTMFDGSVPETPILDRGVVNFGFPQNPNDPERGLIIRKPGDPADESLARRTIFVGALTGEITGTLKVGSIWRLQAGVADATPSGVISATITTLQVDNWTPSLLQGPDPFRNTLAIEAVAANNLISGNIEARSSVTYVPGNDGRDAGHPNTYANIQRIIVGPSLTAGGITGDIVATHGKITRIFSTGPIGTANDQVKIWAADGIDEIRIIDESDPAAPLDRDLFVDVKSGTFPSLTQEALVDRQR